MDMKPSKSITGAASHMQLPPSPELAALSPPSHQHAVPPVPDYLTLAQESRPERSSRLRAIAKHGTFCPRVIACSMPPVSSLPANDSTKGRAQYRDDSSLIALAGPNGVLLTRVSRPQTPLAILSHVSSTNSQSSSISTLAFQPPSSDSSLLAAGRGSGVLIWDASGHSLSPLLGRLGSESGTLYTPELQISSLDWKKGAQTLLATTTANTACIWDVRTSIGPGPSRPSLRFGKRATGASGSPLIQIVSSEKEECAILDRSGIVRVYDMRMSDRSQLKADRGGELVSFSAFGYLGVGMAHFSTSRRENCWLAWGLDKQLAPAVVKIWSTVTADAAPKQTEDEESYWFMDGSSERSPARPAAPASTLRVTHGQYRQVAQFTTPGLACARVCPSPFGGRLVSVGLPPSTEEIDRSGFQVDVWKFNFDTKEEYRDISELQVDTFGVEKVATFCGGSSKNKHLALSIGSITSLGALRGAELALDMDPQTDEKELGKEESSSPVSELQLCCLSDDGLVTSYALMDNLTKNAEKPTDANARRLSPLRKARNRNLSSEETKIFSGSSQDTTVFDAATALRTWMIPSTALPLQREDELFPTLRKIDTITTQFHVDVQESFGLIPASAPGGSAIIAPNVSPADPAANASVLLESNDDIVAVEIEQVQGIVARIDKGTVPSPRLCGASFSAASGGIICFQNGDVKKMWAWFRQSDPKHHVQPSDTQRGGFHLQARHQADEKETMLLFAKGDLSNNDHHLSLQQQCPRTLQDLENMTQAAKKAQWKDNLDTMDSADGDSEGSADIFDDSSDGSSTVSDDITDGTPQKRNDALSGDIPVVNQSTSFVGPSSDLLAPVVSYSQLYETLVFNRQSSELAKGWLLGEWESEEVEQWMFDASNASGDRATPSTSARQVLATSRSDASSQSLSPTSSKTRTQKLPSMKSDPILAHLAPKSPRRGQTHGVSAGDDAPVRAGAYSVRPNRQESMVFLRKLFQQQEARTLLSPPDEPLLPKKKNTPQPNIPRTVSSAAVLETLAPETVALDEPNSRGPNTMMGITTLSPRSRSRRRRELTQESNIRTKEICHHNTDVCLTAGQPDKASTWSLLAQLMENLMQYEGDDFNGWNGGYCGALGHDLVTNVFEFYELQGDVQMLATMVCVLSQGQRKPSNGSPRSLLPLRWSEKYDGFISRYADILFAWGLLTERAELNKHLLHPLPEAVECEVYPIHQEGSDGGIRTPGVAIVAFCSICNQETPPGSIVCRKCRTIAFRCTMCSNAVRGLFTVCWACGHGGHTNHILSWFENHKTCPTGCGCNCVLATLTDDGMLSTESAIPSEPHLTGAKDEVVSSIAFSLQSARA